MRIRFAFSIISLILVTTLMLWPSPVLAAAVTTVATTTAPTDQAELVESVPVELSPSILSESAVLMDAATGQILYSKNMDEILYPASVTKVMTALVALERGQLTDVITMSHNAVYTVERGSSHIALDEGEQITLEQALYALGIASANDAANGIAEQIGGTIEGFASLMNERAIKAGARNTHFSNANGLPDPNHTTTARDMALITRAAVNTPGWTKFFCCPRYEIPPTNLKTEPRQMYSYNAFINGERKLEGIIACKTGYTTEAHHTLVTVASRNNRTLIVVVMKSELQSAKWIDTVALMDYGFKQFRPVTFEPNQFPQDVVTFTDTNGTEQQATLAVTTPVQLWLHQTVKASDVQLTLVRPDANDEASLNQAAVKIDVGGQFADRMSIELMSIPIVPQVIEKNKGGSITKPAGTTLATETLKTSGWVVGLLIFLASFGLAIVAVVIRQREINRRRRRERLAQYRRNYQENQIRYH
jgi:D-alanyl-D-alanine carboxypeptidase (penicillin-binding protein 5/6)